MYLSRFILLSGVLVLSACATQHSSVPVEDRSSPEETAYAKPVESATALGDEFSGDKAAERIGEHPAVIALLDESQRSLDEGNNESAIAALERGVRLQPKNALLWHRLAAIYLKREEWRRVIPMAQKSISLAASDRQLQITNWKMIELASQSLGDGSGAKQARREIKKLGMNN